MVKSRHGKEWTKDEDRQLKDLFNSHHSFYEMGEKLGRTWFACKCRLARLGLIKPFERNVEDFYIGSMEKYKIPNCKEFEKVMIKFDPNFGLFNFCDKCEEDTSNTFSNAELNVVTDYLKTRLSRVVCKLADGDHCFIGEVDLKLAQEVLETEISVANSMKKITVEEREKVLKRLC